jgi:hypothetical protein
MSNPHTDKLAKPQSNSLKLTTTICWLISVVDSNVRNATVDGTYRLYEIHNTIPYLYRGNTVIDVDCSWYQWRPRRDCIRLILRNSEVPFLSTNIGISYITNIER